jgi:hypothetical protein
VLAKDLVAAELQLFPQAQLIDIYKLFYQSAFGPGHIISDADAARQYLRQELAEAFSFQGPSWQDISFFNQYYRVNLALVANGKLDFADFFAAFLQSVHPTQKYCWSQWQNLWRELERKLPQAGFSFQQEIEDRQKIEQILSDRILAFSHSKTYKSTYLPHYRLINKAGMQALQLL